MQIDQKQTLSLVDGKPITHSGVHATLGRIMVTALLNAPLPAEKRGEEMSARHRLAKKINGAGATPIEMSREEVDKIKELIIMVYGTAVAGPAWEALDAQAEPPAPDTPPAG